MKIQINRGTRDNGGSELGLTLIEVIGVLALVAVLAAIVLPLLIRQLDKSAADQEIAVLQSIGNALPQNIMRSRYFPGPQDWMTNVASELGMNVSDVKTNARGNARFMVIDPNLSVGVNGSGLPYSQTNWSFGSQCTNSSGQIVGPSIPRVMVLSTLGVPFPTSISNGVLNTASDFTNIWNWDDTSSTLPTTTALSTWGGKAEDLKVQRINLAPIFVDLVLSTYASTTNGFYSVDWASTNAAPYTNGIEGFFIQGTILGLFQKSSPPTLDSQQVLIRNQSFVFEAGVWKGSIVGGTMVGGFDVAGVVAQFLSATTNQNAAAGQQVTVVNDFLAYMSNYDRWASGNFTDNSMKNYLKNTLQPAMMNAVQSLYVGSAYPTNSGACQ